MHRIFFVLLFTAITSCLYSQSWTPINSIDKYNYKINNNDTIVCTIFSDSLTVLGSDSIFYLNKVFGKCDSCYGNNQPYTTAYNGNHSQFLKSIIKKTDNWLIFADTSNYYIKLNSILNESWVFDSISNISATLVNTYVQNIFNTSDSVKLILLSTNDTIILSKQFGIIRFPVIPFNGKHYQLVGIEGRNLGLITPKASEIFNFSVGSIFQYKGHYLEPETSFYFIYQITILENLSQQDTLKYRIEKIGKRYDNPYTMTATSLYSYIDTLKIAINPDCFFNSFSNNLVETRPVINGAMSVGWQPYNFADTLNNWNTLTSFYDSAGVLVRTTNGVLIEEIEMSNNYSFYKTESGNYYYIKYVSGLGQISYSFNNFEQVGYEDLIGSIINGDTLGNVVPTYLLTSNNTGKNQELFKYSIDSQTNKLLLYSDLSVSVFDILGKQLYKKNIGTSYSEVNLSFLKNGIYLIVLGDKKRQQTIKFIKKQ